MLGAVRSSLSAYRCLRRDRSRSRERDCTAFPKAPR